jgi:hypothetical protein
VDILGLNGIDYRQLRRIFRLVALDCATTKWARFTFRDLAACAVAIELAGGKAALGDGRRLRLDRVERACYALQKQYGIKEPLLDVPLRLEGTTIVATIEGFTIEAATGQRTLGLRIGERALRYAARSTASDAELMPLRSALGTEFRRRPARRALTLRSSLHVAVVKAK